jgi:hypothetical protein
MARKVYYHNERDLEGLKWTSKIVDFGVGLMVTAAINEMHNAYTMLVDRKDLLKGKTKQFCNRAFKEAKLREIFIKENMVSKQFWLDYSDRVIDEAQNDITFFRIAVKQTLDNAKIKDSVLISYIETARTMLDMAVEQYKSIMEQAKKKYGRDYSKEFASYRLDSVFYWWNQMCGILYKGYSADLNNEYTTGMFDRMCKKFAEGEYIQACLQEAYNNNPDFVDNSIKVKEE